MILGRGGRGGDIDRDGVEGVAHGRTERIVADDGEGVRAGGQGHAQRPVGQRRPSDVVGNAVDLDARDLEGRAPVERDEVVGRRKVHAPVVLNFKGRSVVGRDHAEDIGPARGDEVLDPLRTAHGRPAGGQPVVACIENGIGARGGHEGVGRCDERLPVDAGEGRMIVARAVLGPADAEEIAIGGRAAEGEVHVPEEELPLGPLRLVGEGVLAAAIGEAVPVVIEMLGDVNLIPLGHIDPIGQGRGVSITADGGRRLDRVHQRKDVGVVVEIGWIARAARPRLTIARNVEGPTRGRVAVQVRARRRVAGFIGPAGRVAKFKAELDLVQLAVRVIGKPLVDEVAVRLLRVQEDLVAALAVGKDEDVAVEEKGRSKLPAKPVTVRFRLGRSVPAAVAGAEEVDVILPEQPVVIREAHVVITTVADRRIVARRMIGAAVEPGARVIDDAVRAVGEGHILGPVAHLLLVAPLGHRGLAHPKTVSAERAGQDVVAPHDETFPHRRVVRELGGQRGAELVRRLNVEGRDDAGNLGRQHRAVESRAVVGHGQTDEVRGRIEPVIQQQRGKPVRILHARRHQDLLARGGQNGPVRHVRDGRADVGRDRGIGRARRAQIAGRQREARRLVVIAPQPEQDVRIALEPAHLGSKRHVDRAARESERQLCAHAVCARVAPAPGPQMQRARTGKSFVGLPACPVVVALENPVRGAGLEGAVADEVRAVIRGEDFHVVHQTLACAHEGDVQLRGVLVAVDHRAGRFHVHPAALGRLVAVGPVGRETMIAARVPQFQTAAVARRPPAPAPAGPVADFIDHNVNGVGRDHAETVRRHDHLRHGQRHAFAAVFQGAFPVAQAVARRERGITAAQPQRVGREYQITIGWNHRAARNGEFYGVLDPPLAHVHRVGRGVEQLDEFIVAVLRERVVHDFVDHHGGRAQPCVVRAGRERLQPGKARRPVREPSGGDAVLLGLEAHPV